MEFELIKELIKLVNDSKIVDFQMNYSGISLRMAKSEVQLKKSNATNFSDNSTIKNDVIEEIAIEENLESYIVSPVVGLYHLLIDEGNRAIIKLGDKIKREMQFVYIEILNVNYEIKSNMDGQVAEILAQDGCIVEYGQILFKIKQNN